MDIDYGIGEYIVYHNGDRYEIGRIASFAHDGAFVCYSSGETAAKTAYSDMHKLVNGFCITETELGGDRFKGVTMG